MIGPDASAFGFAFSSSSASATSSTFSSRSSRPWLCFAETSRELRRAAPLLGLQPLGGELAAHAVGVRVRQVDLVDRDDDRHLGRARVRDRLLRLRHHAVVGGDDEHGDVGHLGAAGAHGGERLVAGRVEERDLPAVVVDLVGADVLRDPAGLGLDDRGLADRVEQRRLAVVDVAHDRDHRRPRRRGRPRSSSKTSGSSSSSAACLIVTSRLTSVAISSTSSSESDWVTVLICAEAHQDLDQLRHRDAERLGEILDGDAGLDGHRPGRRGDRRRLLRRSARCWSRALPAVLARARGAGVDDDAALAAAGRRALAGPDRAVGPVRSVSHSALKCRAGPAPDRRARSVAARG